MSVKEQKLIVINVRSVFSDEPAIRGYNRNVDFCCDLHKLTSAYLYFYVEKNKNPEFECGKTRPQDSEVVGSSPGLQIRKEVQALLGALPRNP